MRILKTRRLGILAALTPEGARVADIGTDHAWLPVALVASERASAAIGIDRLPGPLRHAQQHVARAGLTHRVSLRLGDGLAPLTPEDAIDTIIIAGMGGLNMANILASAPADVLAAARTLILQPNTELPALRAHLLSTGWHLHHERLIEDRGRFYTTLLATPTPPPDATPYTDAEIALGRLTPDTPNTLDRWRDHHRATLTARAEAMRLAATPPPELAEVEQELAWLSAPPLRLPIGAFAPLPLPRSFIDPGEG